MAEEPSQTGERKEDAPAEPSPGTDAPPTTDESSGGDAGEALAWSSMDLPGMDPVEGNE